MRRIRSGLRAAQERAGTALGGMLMAVAGCSPLPPVPAAAPRSATELSPPVVERVKRATVLIGNFEGDRLSSTGSGFLAEDGHVYTNAHVVTGRDGRPDPLRLVFDSGTAEPKLVDVVASQVAVRRGFRPDGKRSNFDLAAIRVANPPNRGLPFGATRGLAETRNLWAFGFPVGLEIARSDEDALPGPTVHCLAVERIERAGAAVTNLQLGGTVTFGSSGACVVDADGRVLGVLEAKQAESIAYAIPVDALRNFQAERAPEAGVAAKSPDRPARLQDFTRPLPGSGESGLSGPIAGSRAATRPPDRPAPQRDADPVGSLLGEVRLTRADLAEFSARELTLLRNEPFARRGYIFRRADLRAFYSQYEWYVATTSDQSAVQRSLTRLEAANVDLIRRYQRETGRNW